MEICPAYFLETNLNCEKQMILLIISNKWNEGWYYLAVKKLSALLKRITSKHDRYFYFLIAFILLEQKISWNLNLMKKCVKINIFMEL